MIVLVLNPGSSSLKYQIMDMKDEVVLAKGLCERIGIDGRISYTTHSAKIVQEASLKDHKQALNNVIDLLTKGDSAVIEDRSTIRAIAQRLASGLENYPTSVKIDEDVIEVIKKSRILAPLHIPGMLDTIKSCQELFPKAVQVAVFDSSFHSTLEEKNYIYALPFEYYEKYGFRKYGYHGTSSRYVMGEYFRMGGKKDSKVIICHLGNGSSIVAVKDGRSIDVSTGFSTSEGVMMGTRSGSIDPMILLHAAKRENLSIDEAERVLFHYSGLLGVSGVSSDYRDVKEEADKGNHRAKLAIEILAWQVKKFIGSYAAEMNGLDALIFTGGIGENADDLRLKVCSNMEFFGIILDEKRNLNRSTDNRVISTEESSCQVWVIPTNEELVMARDALRVARSK